MSRVIRGRKIYNKNNVHNDNNNKDKGFTLVEVLAVVVIISVVIGVGLTIYFSTIEKSKEKARVLAINNIANASELYSKEYEKIKWLNKYEDSTDVNVFNVVEEYVCVTVNELINSGYFKKDFYKNELYEKAEITGNTYVRITRDIDNKANFNIDVLPADTNRNQCELLDGDITIKGKDFYTDTIVVNYTDKNVIEDDDIVESYSAFIKDKPEGSTIELSGTEIKFSKLKNNTKYTISVCVDLPDNGKSCSHRDVYTADFVNSEIGVSDFNEWSIDKNVTIKFDDTNIYGDGRHYFYSEVKADVVKSDKNTNPKVSVCSEDEANLKKCSVNSVVNSIEVGKWYYTEDEEIKLKVTENLGEKEVDKKNIYVKVLDQTCNKSCENKDKCINNYVYKIDNIAPEAPAIYTMYQIWKSRDYGISGSYSKDFGVDGTWTTTGGDPYIYFNDVSDISGINGAYVELDKALSVDLPIQIFYATSSGDYSEANSNTVILSKGNTKIVIPFAKSGTWTKVRFDIGSKSGLSYKIKSLAVMASSNQWNRDNIILQVSTKENGSGVDNWQYTYAGDASKVGDDNTKYWKKHEDSAFNPYIPSAYTAERNQPTYIRVCDKLGNCSNDSSTYIKIDKTGPVVTFGTNGNSTAAKSQSSKVTVTDKINGNVSTLKYLWSKSNDADASGGDTFTNEDTISKNGVNGKYYLCIYAKDGVGNATNTCSKAFKFAQQYIVKYDCNGGSGAPDSKTATYDSSFTIASNTCTRTGYTFAGWTTNSNGTDDGNNWTGWSGTWVYDNGQYGITNNVLTLYARWQLNTYTITYKGNGGTWNNTDTWSNTATYDQSYTIEPNFYSRQGYTFLGWTTNSDGTDDGNNWTGWSGTWVYDNGDYGISNNSLILYARWTPNVVSIAYNPNGGTVTASGYGYNEYGWVGVDGSAWFHSISYPNSSDPYNASTFGLTKTGYTFDKWYLYNASDGITSTGLDQNTNYASTVYYDQSNKSKNTSNTSQVHCYLYAGWKANTYTITYNANGGSGAPSVTTYTYASSGTTNLSSTKPSRAGYTFLGWSLSSTATSASYSAGQAWNLNNASNYTLYAVWKSNTQTYYVDVSLSSSLNCRTGASTSYSVKASYACGTAIEGYPSSTSGWTYYPGNSCYLNDKYLVTSKPICTDTYYVTASSGLKCRSGPGTDYSKVTAYTCGTALEGYPSSTSGWTYYPGNSCYLSSKYLSTTKKTCSSSSSSSGYTGTCQCQITSNKDRTTTYNCAANNLNSSSDCSTYCNQHHFYGSMVGSTC